MSWLRTLPITFQCELNAVKIINFSVDRHEVQPTLPEGIEAIDFGGKVIFSMADLQVKQMRPRHFPKALSFSYRHIAMRLLVRSLPDDESHQPKVYFFKCFADKKWVSSLGNRMTYYQLSPAIIRGEKDFHLQHGSRFFRYQLSGESDEAKEPMFSYTKQLHAAYAREEGRLKTFKISPRNWPLSPVTCTRFETNIFQSASYISSYEATESIPFLRFPAKRLLLN